MSTLYLFAHTHWDREWYRPFETFRIYLVAVVRQIVEALESGELERFYLDGQSVVLEDVVELAPELAPRLTRLLQDGKLAAGPWYVLPDQMLVSGESLIRNLAIGLETTEKFGPPALTGYSPDTFGHSVDLPRILSGFGIKSAFVWRGVPRLPFGQSFWWQSPDGSEVLAYHLSRGYANTIFHDAIRDAQTELAAIRVEQELKEMLGIGRTERGEAPLFDRLIDGALVPVGTDHSGPPRYLKAVADALEESGGNGWGNGSSLSVAHVHPAEFAAIVREKLESTREVVGFVARELRDNCASEIHGNAYLLPGVLSSRLYLKQANRQAEWRLSRFAEPLLSLLSLNPGAAYPRAEMKHAWKLLLRNHPHDSICGCSIDAVHDEMMTRYARINQIVDALFERASREISLAPHSGILPEDPDWKATGLSLFNVSGRTLSAPVPVRWFRKPGSGFVLPGAQVSSVRASNELFSGWGTTPYYKEVEVCEGFIWADGVPAFGELRFPFQTSPSERLPACQSHARSVENGLLRVEATSSGDLSVTALGEPGSYRTYVIRHRIKDVGDGGDTYNFDPLPDDTPIYARLSSTRAGQKGPHVASVILTYEMKIPAGLIEQRRQSPDEPLLFKRSSDLILHVIETEVTVKRGSQMVFFETRWLNRSVGHRLEVVFDTGGKVSCSYSENHFSLVRREHPSRVKHRLPVPAGQEAPCDRFPCQRFFVANSQTFVNGGLPEYGVDGSQVSITLLRSVDILSRGRIRTRGGGAGPHLSVPGAACLGEQATGYAWTFIPPHKMSTNAGSLSDQARVAAYEAAEEYESKCFAAFVRGNQPTWEEPVISVDNPAVKVVSISPSKEEEGALVRLLNVTTSPQAACIQLSLPNFVPSLATLSGEALPADEAKAHLEYSASGSSLALSFSKNELITLRLSPSESSPRPKGAAKKKTVRKKTR